MRIQFYKKGTLQEFGIILLAIGLCTLIIGLIWFIRLQSFRTSGVEAVAEVTGLGSELPEEDGIGTLIFFKTKDGTPVHTQLDSESAFTQVGDSITIFYDPESPEKVMEKSNESLITLGVGLCVAGAGTAVTVADQKKRRAPGYVEEKRETRIYLDGKRIR